MFFLIEKVLNYWKCLFQLIPEISSLTWFTTIVPLVLVISMTAVKDATDDYVGIRSRECLMSQFQTGSGDVASAAEGWSSMRQRGRSLITKLMHVMFLHNCM